VTANIGPTNAQAHKRKRNNDMKLRKRKSFVLTVSENVIHQERSVLHHPVAVNVIDVIILVFTGRIQHESQVLLFCLGLPRRLWCYRPQMLENETFLYFF
jgi:hypothetical protein